MQPFSPVFIFLCLPLGFLLLRFLNARARLPVLLGASCLLIAWGSPRDAVLVLLGAVFNHFTAAQVLALKAAGKTKRARAVFLFGAAADIALLLFFKYTGFALGAVGMGLPAGFPAAPVGVSFYTFSAVSFLTDVYRGSGPPGRLWDTALYLTFYPKFLSGPIVPYRDFAARVCADRVPAADTGAALARFAVGLGKKAILADTLSGLFAAVTGQPLASLGALDAWLGVLLYAFTLYFDFSGYSDMAIGLARLSGYTFDENFSYPYLSESLTQFWRRWHISLGTWFRDYVYIPLGGSRRGRAVTARNIAVVWLLTGLWHGANWTFIVWGLYNAALLLLEKFVFGGWKEKLPKPVNVFFTFLLAVVGWVPFFSESLPRAGEYLLRMAGVGGAGLVGETALFFLGESAVWLVLGILGAAPLLKYASDALRKKKWGGPVLCVCLAVVLVLSAAAVIGGTARGFLYAQF